MTKTEEAIGVIGAIVQLVQLAAKSLGMTTSEVLAEVAKENARIAADPADETEPISREIDENLP